MLPIGYQIYLKRLELGLTQNELAGRVHIPQSNLSNIEKGKRDLTVSTLRRIAAAMNVHPRDFFAEADPKAKHELSRQKIERIAKLVAGKAEPKPEEMSVTHLFKQVVPRRGRKYVKDLNRSWLELHQQFNASEINSICERVGEYKRRSK